MRADPASPLEKGRGGREARRIRRRRRVANDDLKPAKGLLVGLIIVTALYFAVAVIVALA